MKINVLEVCKHVKCRTSYTIDSRYYVCEKILEAFRQVDSWLLTKCRFEDVIGKEISKYSLKRRFNIVIY